MKLLNREMLCVSGEHILLDCVIRWTMFNKDTRQSFLGEILESCISLSDLDDQSFRRLLKHELVHSTPLEMDITNLMKSGSKGHVTRGYINVLVVTGGEGLVVERSVQIVKFKVVALCLLITTIIVFHPFYYSIKPLLSGIK